MNDSGNDTGRDSPDRRGSDDHEYHALLRAVSGEVPDAQVDWDAFHRRLAVRAGRPLAHLHIMQGDLSGSTRRGGRSVRAAAPLAGGEPMWWEYAARWWRVALPLALAAGVALVVLIRSGPDAPTAPITSAVVAVDDQKAHAAFESAVIGRGEARAAATLLLPTSADLVAEGGEGSRRE